MNSEAVAWHRIECAQALEEADPPTTSHGRVCARVARRVGIVVRGTTVTSLGVGGRAALQRAAACASCAAARGGGGA